MSGINKSLVEPNSVAGIKERDSVEDVEHTSSMKQSVIERISLGKLSIMNKAAQLQLIIYEVIAMFIFTYGVSCFPCNIRLQLQAMVSLLIAIVICAPLCGANLNPAITLCNFFRKENKYSSKVVWIYLLAQLVGAMLALAVAYIVNDVLIGPLAPEEDVGDLIRLMMSEAVGTFLLVFFTLQISNPNTTFIENQLSGYGFITLSIYIGRQFAFSPISTTNFTLTLSINIMQAIKGNYQGLKYIYLWLIGDIIGMVAATLFYDGVFEPTIKDIRDKRRTEEEEEYKTWSGSQPSDKLAE